MPLTLKITEQERAQRLIEVRESLASVRLEGLELEPRHSRPNDSRLARQLSYRKHHQADGDHQWMAIISECLR